MDEEPELIDVKLPAPIVQKMREYADLSQFFAEGTMPVSAIWGRALAEHNPEPEPPLQTGDWATRTAARCEEEGCNPAVHLIVAVPDHVALALVYCGEGDVGYNVDLVEHWERCDPPSDPVVRAALLRCIGREDTGDE